MFGFRKRREDRDQKSQLNKRGADLGREIAAPIEAYIAARAESISAEFLQILSDRLMEFGNHPQISIKDHMAIDYEVFCENVEAGRRSLVSETESLFSDPFELARELTGEPLLEQLTEALAQDMASTMKLKGLALMTEAYAAAAHLEDGGR